MSRRGHSRAAAAMVAAMDVDEPQPSTSGGHNTLQIHDEIDPVKNSIRFNMESIIRILNETIPYCSVEDGPMSSHEKQEIHDTMEQSLLQMVEADLTYSKAASIVNEVVDELALQDNQSMPAEDFADAVDSIADISNDRIAAYQATLTESVLRSHPTFIRLKRQLEAVMTRKTVIMDNADAETEAEEVDLDDSQDDADEVIPDLDPITKQPLEDPVRNSICRHIYGKASMLQLIKKNPKTRCPAMGCDNTDFVKASHLEDDPILTARVNGESPPAKMARTQTPKKPKAPKAKRGRRRR